MLLPVKKTLFLFAHPNMQLSRANRQIAEAMVGAPNVTFRSLYDIYPEFFIDVKAEQDLLREHDSLVLQHPFYWYSMPPLLKLWFDTVLEFGFAYGDGGQALAGKNFLLSITAGGPLDSYRNDGYNYFPVSAFFPPYEQTARLCGMRWHEPIVLHHSTRVSESALGAHGAEVRRRVLALSEGAR